MAAALVIRGICMYNGGMKHRWIWAWALQIAALMAADVLAALAFGLGAVPYALALWLAAPLAGLFITCRAVLGGLNNYAALIAPIPCLYAAHSLVWGFSPPFGAALAAEGLALVGAAAGEVLVRRKQGRR